MKQNQEPEDDRALQQILRGWMVDDPLPPRFQEQVWQKIARAEAASPLGFWTLLTRLMEVVLPQPKVAYSYVAALLVLGLAAGAWAAEKQNNRMQASLGSHYLQVVDPYQPSSPDR